MPPVPAVLVGAPALPEPPCATGGVMTGAAAGVQATANDRLTRSEGNAAFTRCSVGAARAAQLIEPSSGRQRLTLWTNLRAYRGRRDAERDEEKQTKKVRPKPKSTELSEARFRLGSCNRRLTWKQPDCPKSCSSPRPRCRRCHRCPNRRSRPRRTLADTNRNRRGPNQFPRRSDPEHWPARRATYRDSRCRCPRRRTRSPRCFRPLRVEPTPS